VIISGVKRSNFGTKRLWHVVTFSTNNENTALGSNRWTQNPQTPGKEQQFAELQLTLMHECMT
jgi:hypothetical protein